MCGRCSKAASLPAAVPGLRGEDLRPVRELQRQQGRRLPHARGPGGAPGGGLRERVEAARGLRGPAAAAQRPLQAQPAPGYVREPAEGEVPAEPQGPHVPAQLHGVGRPALGEGDARVFSHQHLMIRIWIILYSSKPLYWAPSVGQILGKERTGRSSRPWTFSVCWGSSHQTELNYRQINALEGPFAESSAGTCHPDAKVPSLPGPSWHYFSLCQEVCPGHTASYELKPNVIRKDIDQGRKITEPRGVSAACAAEGEAGMRIAE